MKIFNNKPRPSVVLTSFLVVMVWGLVVCGRPTNADEWLFSIEQQERIHELIRQYIHDHPEVILDSLRKMEARKGQERAELAKKQVVLMRRELEKDPSSPVGGNPDGDVTIVEFFDYRCGYCKRIGPTIIKTLETDANVRFVFKELPILGEESVVAARAALASWKLHPENYQKFHFALMNHRGKMSEKTVMAIASEVGLGVSELRLAMQAPGISQAIEKNRQLAEALNINGTPAFVIGTEIVPGAINFATMKKLIAKARKN